MSWAWLFLLVFPITWIWMNEVFYKKIWGRRLKWRYIWAVHGALLATKRLISWEQNITGPRCVDCRLETKYIGRKPGINWFECPTCGALTTEPYR